MVDIEFTKNSKRQFLKLNERIQQKVVFILDKFKEGIRVDVIKLKNKSDEFRIRAGNYRIQLKKIDKGFLITKIGNRENFYGIFFSL